MTKSIPRLLWLTIAALGIMALWCLLIGLRGLSAHAGLSAGADEQGAPFLAALKAPSILALLTATLNVLLLVGLLLGRKWGYALTLAYGLLLAIAAPFGQGTAQQLISVIIFGFVVVPMLICTRFFFPGDMRGSEVEEQEPHEA